MQRRESSRGNAARGRAAGGEQHRAVQRRRRDRAATLTVNVLVVPADDLSALSDVRGGKGLVGHASPRGRVVDTIEFDELPVLRLHRQPILRAPALPVGEHGVLRPLGRQVTVEMLPAHREDFLGLEALAHFESAIARADDVRLERDRLPPRVLHRVRPGHVAQPHGILTHAHQATCRRRADGVRERESLRGLGVRAERAGDRAEERGKERGQDRWRAGRTVW